MKRILIDGPTTPRLRGAGNRPGTALALKCVAKTLTVVQLRFVFRLSEKARSGHSLNEPVKLLFGSGLGSAGPLVLKYDYRFIPASLFFLFFPLSVRAAAPVIAAK